MNVTARIATTLTRALLLFYPASFRREMGAALVSDVERRATQKNVLWLVRLVASLAINAVGAWAEAVNAGPEGPAYVRSSPRYVRSFLGDVRLGFRALIRERLFAISLTVILSLLALRWCKGILIAMQYRHNASEGRISRD